jgi:hypothetical protein
MPSTVSQPPVNLRQALTTRLLRIGGKALADAIHKDESTASRILSGERGCTIAEFCVLLELVELKLVDRQKLCVSRSEFEFMRRTTARAIQNEEIARTLFEDPE